MPTRGKEGDFMYIPGKVSRYGFFEMGRSLHAAERRTSPRAGVERASERDMRKENVMASAYLISVNGGARVCCVCLACLRSGQRGQVHAGGGARRAS
jgi:hypothetical protein